MENSLSSAYLSIAKALKDTSASPKTCQAVYSCLATYNKSLSQQDFLAACGFSPARLFVIAYVNWLDSGAEEGKPFSRRFGLCGNSDLPLFDLFDGLHPLVPFNSDENLVPFEKTHPEYLFSEFKEARAHLNPRRIAWARSFAGF